MGFVENRDIRPKFATVQFLCSVFSLAFFVEVELFWCLFVYILLLFQVGLDFIGVILAGVGLMVDRIPLFGFHV